jgi:hypothetical protein
LSQVADLAEAAAEMLQTDAVTGVEQAVAQALQFFLRRQLAFVDFQKSATARVRAAIRACRGCVAVALDRAGCCRTGLTPGAND